MTRGSSHDNQYLEIIGISLMLVLHIFKIYNDLRKINIVFTIRNQSRFKNQIIVPKSQINKILEQISKQFGQQTTETSNLRQSFVSRRLDSIDSFASLQKSSLKLNDFEIKYVLHVNNEPFE